MRIHIVLFYTGLVLVMNSFFLFVSAVISAFNGDTALFPLLYTAVITLLLGIFPLIYVPFTKDISNKEGLIIVISSWLLSCLVGTLPYILWGGVFNLTNAWFESVSGYTTTGASIVTDVESLPLGLLFWRSATHWIGGMGIIVFVLAILPYIGNAGMILYRSEVSHHTMSKFRFRTRRAARILLTVYVGLTALETLLLLLSGLGLFDAVTHSFATIATGGFSTKNGSIAAFDNAWVEIIIIVFMLFSGIHFGLLYSVITSSFRRLWQSSIVRYYLGAVLVGVVLAALSISGAEGVGLGSAFRQATFQLISIGTSTGFATTDVNFWPPLAKILIVFFMLQCACAGSTSGGIKADRILLFGKFLVKKIDQFLHPHAVVSVRIDGDQVNPNALEMSILYIVVYLLVVFISTVLLAAMGVDVTTAFSGSAATMGNVGPGLGGVGPAGNYSQIPALGKWVLTLDMLLGRLEIFGFIIYFFPETWNRREDY